VLLFNRLAVLRYQRADAHAAAWQAAGLTADEIVALPPGPARDAIEQETNARNAAPYHALSTAERVTMLGVSPTLVRALIPKGSTLFVHQVHTDGSSKVHPFPGTGEALRRSDVDRS
jgi:hypothetical protein